MKKNLIPVTEETAKEIARQFFGFDAPCVQADIDCEITWWEFNVGKIQLQVCNFYDKTIDKFPYGYIFLSDNMFCSEEWYDCCGKIFLMDGKILTSSHTYRYNTELCSILSYIKEKLINEDGNKCHIPADIKERLVEYNRRTNECRVTKYEFWKDNEQELKRIRQELKRVK